MILDELSHLNTSSAVCFLPACSLLWAVRGEQLSAFGGEPASLHHDQRRGDTRLGRSPGVLRQVWAQGDSGKVRSQRTGLWYNLPQWLPSQLIYELHANDHMDMISICYMQPTGNYVHSPGIGEKIDASLGLWLTWHIKVEYGLTPSTCHSPPRLHFDLFRRYKNKQRGFSLNFPRSPWEVSTGPVPAHCHSPPAVRRWCCYVSRSVRGSCIH